MGKRATPPDVNVCDVRQRDYYRIQVVDVAKAVEYVVRFYEQHQQSKKCRDDSPALCKTIKSWTDGETSRACDSEDDQKQRNRKEERRRDQLARETDDVGVRRCPEPLVSGDVFVEPEVAPRISREHRETKNAESDLGDR